MSSKNSMGIKCSRNFSMEIGFRKKYRNTVSREILLKSNYFETFIK